MPSTPINNGQSGLTVRNIINTNFLQHDTDIEDLTTALNAKQNTPIQVTGVSVTNSSWTLSGGFYYKDIANANITASTSVTVIPDNATIAIVEEAVLLPLTESSSGSVRIWAKNIPTNTFTVNLIIEGVV